MEDFNVSLLTSTLVGMVHSPERATRAKALIVEVENFILRKLSIVFLEREKKRIALMKIVRQE
jgi:hypothetical protein